MRKGTCTNGHCDPGPMATRLDVDAGLGGLAKECPCYDCGGLLANRAGEVLGTKTGNEQRDKLRIR